MPFLHSSLRAILPSLPRKTLSPEVGKPVCDTPLSLERRGQNQTFRFAPNLETSQRQLRELVEAFSVGGAASFLTMELWKLPGYASGEFPMNMEQRRLVWYAWALLLHPEKLRSKVDILTWGRFV